MGGSQVSPIDALNGYDARVKSFIAAVVGGIGSITGAVIGGFVLGLGEIMLVAFAAIEWVPGRFRFCAADHYSLSQAFRLAGGKNDGEGVNYGNQEIICYPPFASSRPDGCGGYY